MSSTSGAGGLWDVRIALSPMSLSIWRRFSMARWLTAAPRAPRSWWLHMPLSFILVPFSEKPVFASNAKVRMPNGVVYVSTTEPPTDTVVTTEYRVGDEGRPAAWDWTRSRCASRWRSSRRATVVAAEVALPTSVPAASRTELATVTDCSVVASFWTVTAMFTVALEAETCRRRHARAGVGDAHRVHGLEPDVAIDAAARVPAAAGLLVVDLDREHVRRAKLGAGREVTFERGHSRRDGRISACR